jgi:hypothetical protein
MMMGLSLFKCHNIETPQQFKRVSSSTNDEIEEEGQEGG